MDAQTIKLWVKSLGMNFTELVADGKIPNLPLVKPFEDSNWPTMHPVEGVELLFSDPARLPGGLGMRGGGLGYL